MTPKPWENGEGYPDPTAYNALRPIMQEDAALEGKVNFLIKVLKFIIAESGFTLACFMTALSGASGWWRRG